jgi:hypothetical protein
VLCVRRKGACPRGQRTAAGTVAATPVATSLWLLSKRPPEHLTREVGPPLYSSPRQIWLLSACAAPVRETSAPVANEKTLRNHFRQVKQLCAASQNGNPSRSGKYMRPRSVKVLQSLMTCACDSALDIVSMKCEIIALFIRAAGSEFESR